MEGIASNLKRYVFAKNPRWIFIVDSQSKTISMEGSGPVQIPWELAQTRIKLRYWLPLKAIEPIIKPSKKKIETVSKLPPKKIVRTTKNKKLKLRQKPLEIPNTKKSAKKIAKKKS